MLIGGFQKSSVIDYPGKICAIVFTQGCNFRCPYCHNPELVNPRLFQKPVPANEVLAFLEKRRNTLEGVTVTGGEPLMQENIAGFLKKVKKLGYLVKLDTNGSFPDTLAEIIDARLVDYVAMDVKAPLEKYAAIAGVKVNTANIRRSIAIIMGSGVDHQFRTTVSKLFLKVDDIRQICALIKGAQQYTIQKYIPVKKQALRVLPDNEEDSDEELQHYQELANDLIKS